MMTIDPLETIITWLENALTIVGGRVASKHRYGPADGWSKTLTGVSVHLDGGNPDIYVAIAEPRLEIRIYADDQLKVVDVWRALVELSRSTSRIAVSTSKGDALIQNFIMTSSLSLLYDETLGMDLGVAFFTSKISEEAV